LIVTTSCTKRLRGASKTAVSHIQERTRELIIPGGLTLFASYDPIPAHPSCMEHHLALPQKSFPERRYLG